MPMTSDFWVDCPATLLVGINVCQHGQQSTPISQQLHWPNCSSAMQLRSIAFQEQSCPL